MNKWQRFWGHLRTVRKHRKMVRKLCFKCGLYWQGLTHDLSKYSHTEFWNGVKYFTGTASPHVGERKVKGYSDISKILLATVDINERVVIYERIKRASGW